MKHARADYDRIQDTAGLIPDDEPVFLLRGQDMLAAGIVRSYAQTAELAAALCYRTGDVENARKLTEIARAARVHAELMQEWPKKKAPDLKVEMGVVSGSFMGLPKGGEHEG